VLIDEQFRKSVAALCVDVNGERTPAGTAFFVSHFVDENAFLLPGVNLDFEEIEYRNVGLAVLNLRAPSVLLGFQLGGIVGHRFLSDYRVSMDMGRSELRLEKLTTVATR